MADYARDGGWRNEGEPMVTIEQADTIVRTIGLPNNPFQILLLSDSESSRRQPRADRARETPEKKNKSPRCLDDRLSDGGHVGRGVSNEKGGRGQADYGTT